MDTDRQLPSDGQLAVAARDGVAEAWAELELRHGRVAVAVARKLYGRHGKSRTRIGLDKLRAEMLHGAGTVVDDRNRALRAFRPRCIAAVTDGGFDDSAASSTDEYQALASAFASLPEPWQAALWHHHVDLEAPSGFTDVVGRSVANADLLIGRATEDLVSGFLDELRIAGVVLGEPEQTDRRHRIGAMLPEALVPRVAMMSVADYRFAIGTESTLASGSVLPPPVSQSREPAPAAPPLPAAPTALAAPNMFADPTTPATPPRSVIPVEVDEVTAVEAMHTTREMPVVESVITAERPVLPTPTRSGNESDTADGTPSVSSALRRTRVLVMVLLGAVVAVAVVGAVVAVVHSLSSDGDTDTGGSPAVVEDLDDDGPSEQANVFGLQVTVGESGADLGTDVDVSIDAPGPIFEGSHGALRVVIANRGDRDVTPRLSIAAPDGITVDRVDGATCVGLSASLLGPAQCDLTVPSGVTIAAEVNFSLEAPAIGRFVLDTNAATDPIDVEIERVADLRYGAVGRGDVLMIGNSVLSCDQSAPACAAARDGTGAIFSRRDLPAMFIGAAPAFGVANASSATLDLGESDVTAAFLFWSGDLNIDDTSISADGPIGRVTVSPPNEGAAEIVEATEIEMSEADDSHYLAYADVTDLVTAAGSGQYLVGNIQSVEVGGSHAGWSLVVVTNDVRQPLRQLMIVSPFDIVNDDTAARVVVPGAPADGAPMTMRLLSFDTDRGSTGDELTVNDVQLSDDDGGLFDGSIVGARDPEYVDNFGTGIAEYRIEVDASDALFIEADSTDDEFQVGVIALTIDL